MIRMRLPLFTSVGRLRSGGRFNGITAKRGQVICSATHSPLAFGIRPTKEIDPRHDAQPIKFRYLLVRVVGSRAVIDGGAFGHREGRLTPTDAPHSASPAPRSNEFSGAKVPVYRRPLAEGM